MAALASSWPFSKVCAWTHGIRFPFNSRLVYIGDSIPQALGFATTTQWYNTLSEIIDWANVLGGSRFFVPQGGNQAIGGQDSATIAARFTTDLSPFNAKIVLANGGVNGAEDAAQVIADWDSMISQAASLNVFLIILPILPASTLTPAKEIQRLTVNAYLATQASANVAVVDITGFDYHTDCYPENGVFPGVPAGALIHPNIIGARLLATRMINIINSIVQAGNVIMTSTDPANLFPLGYLAGTTGTLSSASGQVATGWTLDGANAGGATVTGAKAVNPSGGSYQQVTISGSYTGNSKYVALSSQNAISGLVANNQVELTCDLQVDIGSSMVDSVSVQIVLFDATFAVITQSSLFQNNTANNSGGFDIAQFTGTARVMPASIPAASPAFSTVYVYAYLREGGSATPIACTYRIGRVGIRKL